VKVPVLVAVRDLLFRSRIQSAAERLGVPLKLAPRDRPLADAAREMGGGLLLVEVSDPGALAQIPAVRAAGVKVIAFAGHVQEELIASARAAGADEVLSKGQLVARIDAILAAERA
jgi:DNA-binding NarL/FixJ family response regulator